MPVIEDAGSSLESSPDKKSEIMKDVSSSAQDSTGIKVSSLALYSPHTLKATVTEEEYILNVSRE